MQAYKNYVKTILSRTNTYTGLLYSEDPAIFAWELANEPRTSNNYEISRGLQPGGMIKAWISEMAAFVRSLDQKHMVSFAGTSAALAFGMTTHQST